MKNVEDVEVLWSSGTFRTSRGGRQVFAREIRIRTRISRSVLHRVQKRSKAWRFDVKGVSKGCGAPHQASRLQDAIQKAWESGWNQKTSQAVAKEKAVEERAQDELET